MNAIVANQRCGQEFFYVWNIKKEGKITVNICRYGSLININPSRYSLPAHEKSGRDQFTEIPKNFK